MKILIVVPALGDVYGGPSKVIIELAEALSNLRIDVDVVATNANGLTSLQIPLNQWIKTKNYRIQYFDYWNFFDYKFTLSLTKWLYRHVSEYDIVHTHAIFSYPVLPAYWASQKNKIPYVVTPHGMLEPWALAYKSSKKGLYFSLLEKPALQKASTIHMLASIEAENIKALNLDPPLEIVPNGIRCENFDSLPNPEIFYQQFPETRSKKLIIFLGRIDPKKGLDLLAQAFAKVHQIFPETHLIVAGQDNTGYLSTAQNYFKEAGSADAVTFTGMLTGEIKYAALAASTIYVAPSYSEGFSMSVLEGMATGLPCAITTGCNFPEANDVAKIVGIDAEQIANALISFLQDPLKAKDMGDRARQFILETYTWDKVALKMVSVYKNIINKKQG
jgi:glycosyltransferase involved in cell wall biosynthesis